MCVIRAICHIMLIICHISQIISTSQSVTVQSYHTQMLHAWNIIGRDLPTKLGHLWGFYVGKYSSTIEHLGNSKCCKYSINATWSPYMLHKSAVRPKYSIHGASGIGLGCHLCVADAPRPAALAIFSRGSGHGLRHRRSDEASDRAGPGNGQMANVTTVPFICICTRHS